MSGFKNQFSVLIAEYFEMIVQFNRKAPVLWSDGIGFKF